MKRFAALLACLIASQAGAQTPTEVASLQAKLRFLGFSIDTINGVFGPQTRRAVQAFEFSIGMGDEGRLDNGEMALLDAQVAATAYDRFGYRLLGYWSPLECGADTGLTDGLWMEDLAWIATPAQRFPLVETEASAPLVVDWDGERQALGQMYFSAINTGADIRFFPQEDKLLVVAGSQVFALNHCKRDLDELPEELTGSVLEYSPPELSDVN